MTFHIGQKVVCVDGKTHFGHGTEITPTKGTVYTVRSVFLCGFHGTTKIRLNEIHNEPMRYMTGVEECGFGAYRFRPVRETDISIFKAMLVTPPKQRVSA